MLQPIFCMKYGWCAQHETVIANKTKYVDGRGYLFLTSVCKVDIWSATDMSEISSSLIHNITLDASNYRSSEQGKHPRQKVALWPYNMEPRAIDVSYLRRSEKCVYQPLNWRYVSGCFMSSYALVMRRLNTPQLWNTATSVFMESL